MSRSHVLVIAAMPPPVHGQSTVNAEVVAALVRTGSSITLANTSPGSLNRNIRYHLRRMVANIYAVVCALKLSVHRPRRVYSIVESSFGQAYNFINIAVCRALGFEIFLHHHTSKYCKCWSPSQFLLTVLAGHRATHIFLTQEMSDDFLRLYPAAKHVLIVHNARIVKPIGSVSAHVPGTTMRIGLLSNLSLEKGLNGAIDTFLAATAAGLNVELNLAGPLVGEAAEQRLVQAQAQCSGIKYWGPVLGDEKCRFFQNIDVFLFPTLYQYEALPLVILEAMAARVPVIVNNRGYIAGLTKGYGVVVDPGEDYCEAAVATLKRWALDHDALQAAGARCFARFDEMRHIAEQQFGRLIDAVTQS